MTCPLFQPGCVPLSRILNEDTDTTSFVLVSSNMPRKIYLKWDLDWEVKHMILKSYRSEDKILKYRFMGKNEFVAKPLLELNIVKSLQGFSVLCTEITTSLR